MTKAESSAPLNEIADAEKSIRDMGKRIKELRTARGLTLEAVAVKARVSVGLLSQLERGNGNPVFTTLLQIAHALEVPVGRLTSVEDVRSPVVRVAERREIAAHHASDNDTKHFLLSPSLDGALEVILTVSPPGEDTSASPLVHVGEECHVILSGTSVIYLDGVPHELHTGDAMTFSSTTPHWYVNQGDEPCHTLTIITPPTY